jgi:hypothetical protein
VICLQKVAAANELENSDANAGVYGGTNGKYNSPSRDATARDRLLVRYVIHNTVID